MGAIYYAVNHTKRQYYDLNKTPLYKQDLETGEDLEFPLSKRAIAQSLSMRLELAHFHRVLAELLSMSVEAVYTDMGSEMEACEDYTLIGAVWHEHLKIGRTFRDQYDDEDAEG